MRMALRDLRSGASGRRDARLSERPGDVVRCPTCSNVVVVAVTIRERTRMHVTALRWLEPPPG